MFYYFPFSSELAMMVFYAYWDEREHRFREPIIYDYTFSVKFPNIIINAKNIGEAKTKIELINNKVNGIDRFDFDRKQVLQWETLKNTKHSFHKRNTQIIWNRIKVEIEKTESQLQKVLE